MLKKILTATLFASLTFLAQSCAVEKGYTTTAQKSPKKIIKEINNQTIEYKHLRLNARLNVDLNEKNQKVKGTLFMEHEKTILINLSFMGLSIAKAMISEPNLGFYNKLSKQYYQGPKTDLLNQVIGIDLDIDVLQNFLLGNPLTPVSLSKDELVLSKKSRYQIKGNLSENISYVTTIQKINQKVVQQTLTFKDLTLTASYRNFGGVGNKSIAKQIEITAKKGNDQILRASIDYKQIKFLRKHLYEFVIPEKYEPIKLCISKP